MTCRKNGTPRTYLRQAQAALNDWIIYYEPRRASADLSSRGVRQAYFATVRVSRIVADPQTSDHFYAYVSDYLEFDRAVPFREGVQYYESQLRRNDGETNRGAFGRAVRPISDSEYDLIFQAGFSRTVNEVAQQAAATENQAVRSEMSEDPQAPFERPIIERLVARPFRESAFVAAVKSAYSETCGFSRVHCALLSPLHHCALRLLHHSLTLFITTTLAPSLSTIFCAIFLCSLYLFSL